MNLAAANPAQAGAFLLVFVVAVVVGFVVGVTVQACIVWLISKLVTPATGTFRNAWRYVGWMLVFAIGSFIFYFILGFVIVLATGTQGGVRSWFLPLQIFSTLLAIGISIRIVMYVYEVSFLRALAFKLVIYALAFGLLFADFLLVEKLDPVRAKKLVQQWQDIMQGKKPTFERPGDEPPVPSRTPLPVAPTPPKPLHPAGLVGLVEAVRIPVVIGGANAGEVTLNPGTVVKLISVEGDQAKIQYMDSVATIPLKSTDYEQTQTLPPNR